jgi:hypothetical protein
VTCLGFINDYYGDVEYVLSGSPDYTYNILKCTQSSFGGLIRLIEKMIVIAILIFIVVGYIWFMNM